MAIDRQGTGLVIVRICLGVFFIYSAFTKLRWLMDSSILRSQLTLWMHSVSPGSISQSGLALVVGFWTPIFALLAFIMVLNYHVASGAIFQVSFLASPSGLPVLGSTLGLAMGGVRLRWSVRA
jgi:uncharacterized membrane protein YphA (DoxX/SURF4 family)